MLLSGDTTPSKPTQPPTLRLATGVGPPDAFEQGMRPPTIRLADACEGTLDKERSAQALSGGDKYDPLTLPALLVSYYYLEQFMANRHRYCYRDWVMDSGAFSAHMSGVVIDLEAYIDKCHELMANDPKLTEIFALDDIGDWRISEKNTERMWEAGVPAIPCFHFNEPWEVLIEMAKRYPKIALGGIAAMKQGGPQLKTKWISQCFARVWPKKIHGFGVASEKDILGQPFHSTDATNWEMAPCCYGRWKAFGNAHISVRGSKQNLRAEVEWYLELEARARVKWKKQMEQLEVESPTVRLAYSTGSGNTVVCNNFPPSVRLVAESECTGRDEAKAAAFKPRGTKWLPRRRSR